MSSSSDDSTMSTVPTWSTCFTYPNNRLHWLFWLFEKWLLGGIGKRLLSTTLIAQIVREIAFRGYWKTFIVANLYVDGHVTYTVIWIPVVHIVLAMNNVAQPFYVWPSVLIVKPLALVVSPHVTIVSLNIVILITIFSFILSKG